jgi:AraC-like DNA-binding protein
MQFDELTTLADRISLQSSGDVHSISPTLHIIRRERTSSMEAVLYRPVICLILQGGKETTIGNQTVKMQAGEAVLVSHDLPVVSKITHASIKAPYLALILSLEIGIIRSLYEQVGEPASATSNAKSLCANTADPSWIEPLGRYLVLMDDPMGAEVIGPLILREIHFRLLMSPIGGMLRNLLSIDSHASRIAKSIKLIRENYRKSLVVNDLAGEAAMSASSFHEHFKSVTGTTPLQYQKDLRLIEAQKLLSAHNQSVSQAAFNVGYESSTQFSREYSRKFGCSPRHHHNQSLETIQSPIEGF